MAKCAKGWHVRDSFYSSCIVPVERQCLLHVEASTLTFTEICICKATSKSLLSTDSKWILIVYQIHHNWQKRNLPLIFMTLLTVMQGLKALFLNKIQVKISTALWVAKAKLFLLFTAIGAYVQQSYFLSWTGKNGLASRIDNQPCFFILANPLDFVLA